jgi:peptidylprolyl isomerase
MRRALALLLLPVLLLAACGSDDAGGDEGASDEASDETTDTTAAPVEDVEPAEDDAALDGITVTGGFGETPAIEFASPFGVEATARRVLSEGDGEPVEAGDQVLLDYLALNGRDGADFDNSFEGGSATEMPMDPVQVIPGIPRGLVGVPTGSRVLIAVAPDDGFGPLGGNPEVGIQAEDTLVFVVDVQEPREALERAEGTEVEDLPEGLPTVELDDDGVPTVEVPDEDPPTELVAQLLIEGEGAEVEAGQTITVHYRGVLWRNGEDFDQSWERGEPASFGIGTGAVIPAWDEGLVGQKIGSQVLLVVPPADGYGETGNPAGGIEGDDTLVFVVDILDAF